MTQSIPFDLQQYALQNWPQRLVNEGLAAQFTALTIIIPQSAVWQAMSEAVLARSQNQPTSPDDELPYLGQECGLNQYPIESNTAFRERLTNKWEVWPTFGSQQGIIDQLETSGFPPGSAVPVIEFNLPGGGGNTGDYAGTNIPAYPPSFRWYSQFALIMFFTGSVGTGAEGRSLLIDDDQLLTIRQVVAKVKPVDWVCREICLIGPASSGSILWDQVNFSGSYLYEWDGSGSAGIDWGSGSMGGGVERYAANNTWRWRPLYPGQT